MSAKIRRIILLFRKLFVMGPFVAIRYLIWSVFIRVRMRQLLLIVKNNKLIPIPGVTVVGQLTDSGSVNKTLRDFIIALKNAGIPYQTVDTGYKHDAHPSDYAGLLTSEKDVNLSRYTHLVEIGRSQIPDGIAPHRGTILFWEYDSGITDAFPNVTDGYDTVIAMCDFNYEYFKKVYPDKNVKKILYPFLSMTNIIGDRNAIRRKYCYDIDDFIVFFNYNFKTGFNRKNPQGTIRAFAYAFKNNMKAKLLFKTQNAAMFPDAVRELNQLANKLGVGDRLKILDCYIPMAEIYELTASCDVYISLHRGEGFGIGMAEAMSLGLPVIATDYSASTEFVTMESAIPVPYDIVPVTNLGCDPEYYFGVKQWPEPNIEYAGAALIKLFNDSEYRRTLGEKGRKFLLEHFSSENFRTSMINFLR